MKMCVYSGIYTEGLGGTRSSVSSCRCLEDEAHAPPPAVYCTPCRGRRGSPFPWLGKTQSNFSLYIQFCKYNSKCFIHTTTIQTIEDVFGNQNCSIAFLKRSILHWELSFVLRGVFCHKGQQNHTQCESVFRCYLCHSPPASTLR